MPFLIGYAAFNFTTAISEILIGTFALFSYPRTDRKRALAIWMFCLGVWSFGVAMHAINDGDPAKAMLWSRLLHLGAIPIPVAFLDLGMTLAGKRNKRVLWALYGISVIYFAFLFTPMMVKNVQPIGPFMNFPRAGLLYNLYVAQFVGCVIAALVFLGWKLMHSVGKERAQLRFIFFGSVIAYSTGPTAFLYMYNLPIFPFGTPLVVLNSLIIAYAILHHQLLDIRLLLREAALNVLTAGVLAGSTLVIALPLLAIQSVTAVFVGVILMGLLMAFAYHPIRKAIQPAIDRFMFADRFAYLEELANLPNDILEFTNLREMLKFLVTRLVEAGRLDHATVLMYDPGFQAYITTIHHSADTSKETQRLQWNIPRGNPLIELLRSTKRLLSKEEIQASKLPDISIALESLKELDAAACFGVNTDGQLSALVSLGPKQNREPFNQRDLKILEALKLRVENFLAQAMVTTQESLNMVRDSHDMKNDINSLRGRLPWKGYKIETARENLLNQIALIQTQISAIPNLSEEEKSHLLGSLKDVSNEVTRSSQEQYSFLPIEADSLDRLKIKIQNWSEYGRLVSGGFKGDRKFEPVDIKSTVERCVQRWKASAERKNIALVVESEENLSAFGERSLIEQIIENLIDNGLKATEKGSVRVACKRINDKILIEISDTGCGMTPEDLADILKKPFYQGQGREALERSTGIGLVLVHTYAKSMGGEVQAESTVGQGTSFKVFLPISRSAVTAADKTIAA